MAASWALAVVANERSTYAPQNDKMVFPMLKFASFILSMI
jgi:hypothetical protein